MATLAAYAEDALAELCKRSFYRFVREHWHVLEPGTPAEWSWHHEVIAAHLQCVYEDWLKRRDDPTFVQRIRELVVNVPPGSMKSRIVMVAFVAWAWTRTPWVRFMCFSGNPRVAMRDAVYCRQLITSDWYQRLFHPKWKIRGDQDAKGLFANTEGGFRSAMGIESTPAGERAHFLLGDDPNDPEGVQGDTERNSVNLRFDTAWDNRRNDMRIDPLVLIMQRLHENDLSGHLLRRPGVVHLRLPTIADEQPCVTPIWRETRKPGDVLHAARQTADVIEREQAKGSYYFAGQHGQRPSPAGGGMFKRAWFRFWKPDGHWDECPLCDGDEDIQAAGHICPRTPRPRGCYKGPARPLPARFDATVLSMDATFKGHDETDYVVITAWGKLGASRFLLELRRGQWTFRQSKDQLRAMSAAYPGAKKLIEDKANGPAIIDDLEGEILGLVAVNPRGGKEARANAASPQVEAGNVFLPDGAPWLDSYIGEFEAFPKGAHDDQVDSTTQALIDMTPLSPVEAARAMVWR